MVLTQSVVGEIAEIELHGEDMYFQPGAYIASTPGIKIGVRWAGWASLIAGEGLFKLRLSGKGRVFFGAYGGITKEDTLKYSVENIGGLSFKSLKTGIFGGEGFVCRFSGEGRLWIQSHNLSPLINFLNPFRPTKSD